MSKRKKWIGGMTLFLALAGFLWYQVFSSTDISKVGKEEQSGVKIERPEIPPLSLPILPKMEEKQMVESLLPQEKTKNLRKIDYSLLHKIPCLCGCTLTLAECRCPTALEQMRKIGIIPEGEIVP